MKTKTPTVKTENKETELMSKVDNWVDKLEMFPKSSQISLYITVALIIIGQWRISNHDIKLLYSLAMIIGGSACRYGTDILYFVTKNPRDAKNKSDRWWAYLILIIFGTIGLLS